jgi:hypothetical protein
MGVLGAFLKNQKSETGAATVATPATFQPDTPEKSQLSQLSQGANPEIHFCVVCGGVATHGVGWFLRSPENARWFCARCSRASQAGAP